MAALARAGGFGADTAHHESGQPPPKLVPVGLAVDLARSHVPSPQDTGGDCLREHQPPGEVTAPRPAKNCLRFAGSSKSSTGWGLARRAALSMASASREGVGAIACELSSTAHVRQSVAALLMALHDPQCDSETSGRRHDR